MAASARSQIACQLYTLRDLCKTPADIASTLKKVKEIGYDAVQVSGIGKIEPTELKTILDGEGLTCCATHTNLERMRNDARGLIDEHKLLGCTYTALGYHNVTGAKEWTEFAKDFSGLAATLKAGGVELGYHNHSNEFARYDGRTAMQLLLDECGKDVWFEIDTYWVAHGGGDPIQWINKVAGRIPCVHFKDLGIGGSDRKQVMKEVGEGNLNWPGIIDACRKSGVQWFIVEQDNCNGRNPLDSIAQSLRNLRSLGVH